MDFLKQDFLIKTFDEWTAGLNSPEDRISVFEKIRDIPYGLVPKPKDPLARPAGMLEKNRGSCSPKHFLLGMFFERLGIPVQYASCRFLWSDLKLPYPEHLKEMLPGLPFEYHLICRAFINNRWILLDATWDPPLAKGGFLVNKKWDGVSDTQNAISSLKEVSHNNLEERIDYLKQKRGLYTGKERELYQKFMIGFNSWLENIRKL